MSAELQAAAHLLAVVEVAPEKRIRCQASGCGHSVYKRIHVVSVNGELRVLGSECFRRLFEGVIRGGPRYGSSDGRCLTDDERAMLEENTALLVAQIKAEHEEGERVLMEKQQRIKQTLAMREAVNPQRIGSGRGLPAAPRRRVGPTPEEIARHEAKAKLDVRAKWGVDPNAPGWRGLVLQRITEMARELGARGDED